MAALAARHNVTCKLSGLVTEAGRIGSVEDLRPYIDHLIAVFGPERLLWGSDWPVVNRAGGYERWREATMVLLGGLTERRAGRVLGGNAQRIYLSRRGRSVAAGP